MEQWKKAEHDAKGLPVKRVGGSGSGTIKGDQIGDNLMVEVKTTGYRSYTIRMTLVKKVVEEAASQGKMPILRVDMRSGERDEVSVAVIPWETFVLLMETQK